MTFKRFPNKIIPPHYPLVFVRQRLFDMLTENQHQSLVWVNGSAGSGKTVLVCSWLQHQQSQFLWYRMDNGNNLTADLFYFLSLSAQRNYPKKRFKLPVFTAEGANDINAFAAVFFRQLFAVLEKEIALVIDNCQEIENDPDFFQVLQIAVNELPEGLQIICLSRNRPTHLFKRLSLSNDLLDINTESLRFTEIESTAFINWLNPDIDKDMCSALQLKAQGWAAALVLLTEQNKQSNVSEQMPVLLEQQDIFSFLMSEILTNMDEVSIQFLTNTAIFNCFNISMAIALTDYQNAGGFLDDLLNKNFLVDRSAGTQPIYCYHPLLRDLLKSQLKHRLSTQQLNALNRNAISILIKHKKTEEAIPLYVHLQDWEGLKPVLLECSETLINSGRHSSVIAWMQQLPDEILKNDPWLLYWYAAGISTSDPHQSVELLDTCYQQFLTNENSLGLYSAWQLAVDAIFLSEDDNSRFNIWLQRLDCLREQYPKCPSYHLKIRFSATALQLLAHFDPVNPWVLKLVKRCEYGLRIIPIPTIKQMISSQIALYYLAANEIEKMQGIKPYLLSAVENEKLPALPRGMNAMVLGYLSMYQGNGDSALIHITEALDILQQAAITPVTSVLKITRASCHICRGDLTSAQDILDSSFADIKPKQRMASTLFDFCTLWLYALRGQTALALELIKPTLVVCQQIRHDIGCNILLLLQSHLLAKTQQWEAAEHSCALLTDLARRSPYKHYQFIAHLSNAWLGFLLKDKQRALLGIEQFLRIASSENIRFFYGWLPDVITPLCLLAIEHEIEVEFAISMMQVNSLCPPPPQYLEQWAWPASIYCFKEFRIELNGQPVQQDGKSQKKIIELLLTLIALGSQDVSREQISDLLWPDSDGDLAKQALETAIFRLRKMIGKTALLVKDGRVSLNADLCWTDVLACEITMKQLDYALLHNTDDDLLVQLSKRLFHLYQGPFLKQLDSGVFQSKQRQLQNKLIHLIERLITYYEKQENHQQITWLLEQSMEKIPQFKSDYQQLVLSNQKN